MLKTKSEWLALPGKVRKEFDNETKEKAKASEGIVKEWMRTEKWQAYIAEAKKLRFLVRNLITYKKKTIKKLQNRLPPPIPLPSNPDAWPEKVQSALQIFSAEMRKSELGGSLLEITLQWAALGPDDKAKYTEQAAKMKKQYETEMATFRKTDEGAK